MMAFRVVNEMDIRPYPPAERHEMFYKAFADIKTGEAFEFINDHDPKPLYYQMEAESKEPFRWEYLEKRPRSMDSAGNKIESLNNINFQDDRNGKAIGFLHSNGSICIKAN
jgi:uncharacterized protein (DUF2249 family)